MKLEAPPRIRHQHDDIACQIDHISDIGQFQNADIEKLLEKYQDELVGAMESINREVEEAPSSDSSEGTDSDDEFLAEMARVSMTMLPSGDSDRQNDRESSGSSKASNPESGGLTALEDVESAKLEYDAAIAQWKILLQRKSKVAIGLHLSIMRDVCETEDMSPFLLGRLAELSTNEYLNMVLLAMIRRIHNECRVTTNWLLEEMEVIEKERQRKKSEYTREVHQRQAELVDLEIRKLEGYRDSLKAAIIARTQQP